MEFRVDSAKGAAIKQDELKLSLEKIIIKSDSSIQLRLDEWEKAGLRITILVEGFGFSYFNEIPYKSKENALTAYNCLIESIKQGHYSLEINGNNEIKIDLKFDEFE